MERPRRDFCRSHWRLCVSCRVVCARHRSHQRPRPDQWVPGAAPRATVEQGRAAALSSAGAVTHVTRSRGRTSRRSSPAVGRTPAQMNGNEGQNANRVGLLEHALGTDGDAFKQARIARSGPTPSRRRVLRCAISVLPNCLISWPARSGPAGCRRSSRGKVEVVREPTPAAAR
jgi:hypothetical protein